MKKYLKEKGKQALEWANVREDSNMNMQLQKLAEDSLKTIDDSPKKLKNYHKQHKIMNRYERVMSTIQKIRNAFDRDLTSQYTLYPLNDIFLDCMKKYGLSSLEAGEIVSYLLHQNYEIVKTNKFIISNFETDRKYYEIFNVSNDTNRIFFKMLICKLKGLSYKDMFEVTENKKTIFEEYYKKVTFSKELYKKVYDKLFSIIKNNVLSQKDLESIKVLLRMVHVDEDIIDDYLTYLKSLSKTNIIIPKKIVKKEEVKPLSHNEIRRRLSKYYDIGKEEVTKEFNYAHFKEVLIALKELNMLEKRNNIVFKKLSENPLLNDAYFAYLYQKLQFQYPNKEELNLINEYLEEIKKCNVEDALFWQEEIKKILLSLKGELDKSFKYENFVLKMKSEKI